uniref:Mitochondrial-processing peptidase subunit alpha n=1 Tax=Parastrongyloides trichosuri TaxID=131310 RepID=A0A0N4ZQD4_PARTI
MFRSFKSFLPVFLSTRLKTSVVFDEALITPLSKPLSGFENYKHSNNSSVPSIKLFDSEITKFSNGLTVATEKAYGTFSTIGVAVNSGSRYETYYPHGTTHILQKLAFASSQNYPNPMETESLISKSGALLDCQSTRDCFLYASSCFNNSQENILSIIADTLHRPYISDEELAGAKDICLMELQQMLRNPDPEPLVMDWFHRAAYGRNTLGLGKFVSEETIQKIKRQHLLSYMAQYHVPSNIVVAGVGVDHEHFVELVKKHFIDKVPIWESNKENFKIKLPKIDDSHSQYTGGSYYKEADLSNKGLSIVEFPELTHVVLGFEGVSFKDSDFVTFCVMQYLLGGGKSFSAGGPGKGMYTRLYMDVLRYNGSMYNAQAFNHSYSDSGVFCVHVGDDPKNINNAIDYIIYEFLKLTVPIPEDELSRAKQLLKSQLLMNLEQKPVMFEDLARQILGHGKRKSPLDYIKEIEGVSSNDIVRIGRKMLESIPTLVAYGNLKWMPKYDEVCDRIEQAKKQFIKYK